MSKTYKELQEEAQQLDELLNPLKLVGKAGKAGVGLTKGVLKHLLGTETGGGVKAVEGKKLPDVEKT